MASDAHAGPKELYESGLTIPSDSENYSAPNELVSSVHSTSTSPVLLYKPPTFWSVLRGAAINLVLPFVNGLMLGFGELFAHEAAFRLGWANTKVFPTYRRAVGPGVEVRDVSSRRGLRDTTSLE